MKKFFTKFADAIRIILLVGAAITGLLLSSKSITKKNETPFHEINWNPKEVVQTLVTKARAKTGAVADSLKEKYIVMLDKKEAWLNKTDTSRDAMKKTKEVIDTLRRKAGFKADSIEQTQVKALDKIQQWLDSNSDTAIRKELSSKSSLFIHASNFSLAPLTVTPAHLFWVTYKDSNLVGGQITDQVNLTLMHYHNTENFFNKYPGFALWTLLVIMQTMFYCMLTVGFLFHFLTVPGNELYKANMYKPNTLLMLLGGMIVFVFTIYFTLLNDEKGLDQKGALFMTSLHGFFFLVNLLGHLAAAFCLVGMISCVVHMNNLKHTINKPEEGKPPLPSADIEILRAEIKRRFRTYFIFIAIILTLAIFTSGTFYSSMNGLEFIKQVIKDQGYSPVNSDMVYIYGILYSFCLVIIYLPLKFMLGFLDKSIPLPPKTEGQQDQGAGEKDESDNKEKSGILNVLSKSFTGVKEVLITLSPFLASLLQNLWDLIFS